MDDVEVVRRRAARVVVVDGAGRVLLLQGFDPASPETRYWFTPGGGVEPGESVEAAAVRELREETGLAVTVDQLGPVVWTDRDEFPFEGRIISQDQEFFLLRTDAFTATPLAMEPHEMRSVVRLAWFSVDELAELPDTYFPASLPDLVLRACTQRA